MAIKKMLIIKFGAIGDIIHSLIIPDAVKMKHPDCEIHYLTVGLFLDILKKSPSVDKILLFDGNIIQTVKVLFKERYDLILGLNNTLKHFLLTLLPCPKKALFRRYEGVSWVENYFSSIQQGFKDLTIPDRLTLINTDEETNLLKEELKSYPRPYIMFSPGKGVNQHREGRVWSLKHWKELRDELLSMYNGTIFVCGSYDEQQYHAALENPNTVVFSGKTNLKKTTEILSAMDIVISGDSGPVHIASAFDVKTISILGSTSPEKIKPYGKNGYCATPNFECKYCWKKKCKYLKPNELYSPCIESVSTADVLDIIKKYDLLP